LGMDYNELLARVRTIVNKYLEEVLNEVLDEAKNYGLEVTDLPFIAKDFTLRGGKRLRAYLVLLGYWCREWGLPVEHIKPLLASIEFLQSYLLVHDDIMDQDTVRRGGPTVHVWFRDKCSEKNLLGDCIHYGVSQAIITGDYLESLAVNMFSRLNLPSNTLYKLLETYTKGLRTVSYGQYLDVLLSMKPLEQVREEDVLLVHKLKTSSYTVELPLHLGAIASNRYSNELLDELSRYAIPAGIAFQMRDDILGLYGDPSKTGKPVGSDVREKKKTLLIVKAYELADHIDREFLNEIYDRKDPRDISEEDILRVQDIVKKTGSYDYVVEVMKRETSKALEALREAVLINRETKEALKWLLELFISREK